MKKLNPADLSFSIFLFYLLSISVRDVQQRPETSKNREAAKKLKPSVWSFSASCSTCLCEPCTPSKYNRSSEIHKTFGFTHFPLLVVLGCCTWLSEYTPHRYQIQVHTEATKSSDLRSDHFLLLIVLGICSCCGINKTAFNQKRVLSAERDALARRWERPFGC